MLDLDMHFVDNYDYDDRFYDDFDISHDIDIDPYFDEYLALDMEDQKNEQFLNKWGYELADETPEQRQYREEQESYEEYMNSQPKDSGMTSLGSIFMETLMGKKT